MKRLLAVFALVALFATACGSTADTQTDNAGIDPNAEYGSWADEDEPVDDAVDNAVSSEASSDDGDSDGPGQTLGSPAIADDAVPSVDAPAAPQQTAQVLAYAIEASDTLSYSFEQGLSMQLNMMGINMDISPEAGFITGQVSGDDSYVSVDLGLFMGSMFASMGLDPSDAMFADMFGDLENMTMEVWTTESTLVVDMSSLAASIGSLDPAAAGELALFADGPVSIDLAAIASFGGTDAADIVQQFGQGAQATDPALFIESLRAVDAVTEVGPSTVGDTPVTVYSATLTMAEYYAALDMEITDQLGALDDFGLSAGGAEEALLESMLPALEAQTVEMTIMLDADGLVRRIETDMDLGDMMNAMFSSGEMEGAELLGDMSVQVNTWQDFDNYGDPVTIVVPDAVDRTSEFSGLLDA